MAYKSLQDMVFANLYSLLPHCPQLVHSYPEQTTCQISDIKCSRLLSGLYTCSPGLEYFSYAHFSLPIPIFLGNSYLSRCFDFLFNFLLQFAFNTFLYQFQVYNTADRHSYRLQSVPSDSSSAHRLPQIVITVLTIVPMLYLTSPLLPCTYPLVFLNSFTFINPVPTTPIPSDLHQFVFCIYKPVSILFILSFRFHT